MGQILPELGKTKNATSEKAGLPSSIHQHIKKYCNVFLHKLRILAILYTLAT
jgi:hypothetical protein